MDQRTGDLKLFLVYHFLLIFVEDYRCKSGFSLWFQECKDIDECGQTIDWCGYLNCVNTIGSYSCQCGTGLEKFKDFNLEYQKVETKCRDIDECQGVNEYQGINICPQNSVCENTEGTYSQGFQTIWADRSLFFTSV